MRVIRVMLSVAVTILLVAAGLISLRAREIEAMPRPEYDGERIQRHLAAVELELLARDVSHLLPSQREARSRHIRVLREYREGGVFPHNHHVPGERVPVFIDEHGTHCAVGYLIARSGHPELARRIAATRNLATVPELAGDTGLASWLDSAGLSLEEAARIQPTYGWEPPHIEADDAIGSGYAIASVLSGSLSGAALALNLAGPERRWPALLGIAAGVTGVALGASKLDDTGDAAVVGAVNAGLGALSAAVGAWELLRLPGDKAPGGEGGGVAVRVAPALNRGPGAAARFYVHYRF